MTQAEGGPRARYREQTRGEIKQIAMRQLAEGGVDAVAFTRIAKELGLSGPALYRYFAGRDDLLSALIRDAYDDAAATFARIAEASANLTPRERLHALAREYRDWAVAEPRRYMLIMGSPLPGYAAPPDTLVRARDALAPFVEVFRDARPSEAVLPVVRQMETWTAGDPEAAEWVERCTAGAGTGVRAGTALAGAVLTWTRVHGVVSLEVVGQFATMGHDPGTLLEAETTTLADAFGLA
ncbi:TetR/AcrR family transcriptional regulator [Sphaerisporangium album]|uniref:TetR/AcrR family transcriptional regulator n=1 Tax=Sphaerisporangium album TaxID=509200 RepID=A0A367FED9_9ACTN|nr:TetR/AcrR family transcriptional regulator [Sphaerisporangium album]RCG28733.1 TetR/AcrR family transcriptional regulator [Sphaerisporangium album]